MTPHTKREPSVIYSLREEHVDVGLTEIALTSTCIAAQESTNIDGSIARIEMFSNAIPIPASDSLTLSPIGTDSSMEDFGSFFCLLNFYLLYQPTISLECLVYLATMKALDGCICIRPTTGLVSDVLEGKHVLALQWQHQPW